MADPSSTSEEPRKKKPKKENNNGTTDSGNESNNASISEPNNNNNNNEDVCRVPPCYFDKTRLNEVSEGDLDFEREIITIYRETCDEKLPLLQIALETEDQQNSILYSHDIKGSSANIGADAVKKVSEQMEKLCKESKCKDALAFMQPLRDELQETYKVLEKYLEMDGKHEAEGSQKE